MRAKEIQADRCLFLNTQTMATDGGSSELSASASAVLAPDLVVSTPKCAITPTGLSIQLIILKTFTNFIIF